MEVTNVCFVLVSCIALVTQVLLPALRGPIARVEPELADWLQEHGLARHAGAFVDAGCKYQNGRVFIKQEDKIGDFKAMLYLPVEQQGKELQKLCSSTFFAVSIENYY
ncbi:unnamed protein product, partial [Meganyctiphanes norvegica]